MDIFRGSWSNFTDVRDSAVTVGFFDGVHLGHRAILDHVVESAAAQSLRSALVTFEPHPREVLREGSAPVGLITTMEEKQRLIAASGIQHLLIFHFDHGLAQMSAADFVQIVLKGRIGMRRIVIGFNHAFGRHRTGDRETLIAMSRTLAFTVDVVNPARVNDHIVSSSHVRDLISDGHVAQAAEALGRFHSVTGVIVRGFGRGKRLHYPTANLGLIAPGKICPRDGIYAGLARVQGEVHPAAIALGFNPTFTEGKHSVEAHLLDFDRDIYDEKMELQFVERIRSEKKFSGEAELSAQIAADVRAAAELLAARGLLKHVP
ncbi:MAG: bifunctional riboflavin kinase/FAD synthetase [bacterium]|nr:bifunctional riboflavin kinase/FAD synthetase [bacterium]